MTRWLDVKVAAAIAGVSVPTIRRAIKARRLPSYKLQPGGRLVRVREADLHGWIAAQSAIGEATS